MVERGVRIVKHLGKHDWRYERNELRLKFLVRLTDRDIYGREASKRNLYLPTKA